jgi:tungstate transport system substrate-binding protein
VRDIFKGCVVSGHLRSLFSQYLAFTEKSIDETDQDCSIYPLWCFGFNTGRPISHRQKRHSWQATICLFRAWIKIDEKGVSMKQRMRWLILALLSFVLVNPLAPAIGAPSCTAVYGNGSNHFSLATGSPGELGLLKALAAGFAKTTPCTLCWVKAGSGKSLALLKAKKVDLIMVHAPAAEKAAVADGWAIDRTLMGSNEFYIVGPVNDPANVASATSAADAYARVASAKALFFSRGDNSGTHKKELAVWEKAGLSPSGNWYVVTRDFMMATLKRADAEKGYFMTDSSTWVAAKKQLKNLKVLYRGDPFLINTYHGLCQPPGVTKGQPTAVQFLRFVASEAGQKVIGTFGSDRFAEPLYNDAAYAAKYDP